MKATSNQLYTTMVAAVDGQAALEEAWLNAYYENQYWDKMMLELTDTTNDTLAKAYKTEKGALEASTGI